MIRARYYYIISYVRFFFFQFQKENSKFGFRKSYNPSQEDWTNSFSATKSTNLIIIFNLGVNDHPWTTDAVDIVDTIKVVVVVDIFDILRVVVVVVAVDTSSIAPLLLVQVQVLPVEFILSLE